MARRRRRGKSGPVSMQGLLEAKQFKRCGLKTYNGEKGTQAYKPGADDRHNPMNLRISTPSVPEKANGDNGCEVHHEWQSGLWLQYSIARLLLKHLVA